MQLFRQLHENFSHLPLTHGLGEEIGIKEGKGEVRGEQGGKERAHHRSFQKSALTTPLYVFVVLGCHLEIRTFLL